MFSQVDTGAVSERKASGDFAKALLDFANFWAIMPTKVVAAFLQNKEDAFALNANRTLLKPKSASGQTQIKTRRALRSPPHLH